MTACLIYYYFYLISFNLNYYCIVLKYNKLKLRFYNVSQGDGQVGLRIENLVQFA